MSDFIFIPFYSSRPKFHKKVFGDIDGDRRFDISEDRFKVEMFLLIIDYMLFKHRKWLNGMRYVSDQFTFLNPTTMLSDEEPYFIKYKYGFI